MEANTKAWKEEMRGEMEMTRALMALRRDGISPDFPALRGSQE